MKKLITLMLSLLLVLSLVACGASDDKKAEDAAIDMSQYPADPNEWSGDDLARYFKEAGVFTKEDYLYVQDHATYYAGTAVDECVSYMDDDGLIMICIFNTDPANGDADVDAFLAEVKENHTLPEDFSSMPVDHMIGDLIFFYSFTADEEVYNAMETACQQLAKDLGVEMEF